MVVTGSVTIATGTDLNVVAGNEVGPGAQLTVLETVGGGSINGNFESVSVESEDRCRVYEGTDTNSGNTLAVTVGQQTEDRCGGSGAGGLSGGAVAGIVLGAAVGMGLAIALPLGIRKYKMNQETKQRFAEASSMM